MSFRICSIRKIEYDPTCGVKESTYIYRIAYDDAVAYRRKFYDRSVGRETDEKETLPDPKDLPKNARLDTQVVAAEALCRTTDDYMNIKNKKVSQIVISPNSMIRIANDDQQLNVTKPSLVWWFNRSQPQ